MKRRRGPAIAVVAALACATSFAAVRADAEEREPAKNAFELRPLAVLERGFGVQYERFVKPPKFSIATGLAVRSGALADFRSITIAAGSEVRLWLAGRPPFSAVGRGAMVGPYVGFRLDLGFTQLTDRLEGRSVGSAVTVSESFTFGFRATLWRFFEITPSTGFLLVHDIDPSGRIASLTHPTMSFGLTWGWMF